MGIEERAALIADYPDIYYVTDHYAKHPAVLVRLGRIDRASLRDLLGAAWRFVSSEKKTKKTGMRSREDRPLRKSPRRR
jgi:hypothetical protein